MAPIRLSPTAMIMVRSGNGTYVQARSLLDSTASCSVVKKSFVDRLNLHQQFKGDIKVDVPGTLVKLVIKPQGKIVPLISVVANVKYQATGNIPYVNVQHKAHLDSSRLKLADPDFDKAQDVDIILGKDVLNYIFTGSKILTNIPGVEAYGTCFGDVLMGSSSSSPADGTSVEDYGVHTTMLEEVGQPPDERPVHPESADC